MLGLQRGLICQRMLLGQGYIEIALAQLAEVERSVPVGGVHDGHVQLFLAHHVHQLLGSAFRDLKPDPVVLLGILCDLPGYQPFQSAGNDAHADQYRGADLAFS